MELSQELPFIIRGLASGLPLFLVCFGLLIMAVSRRNEARVPANYAIAGVILIIVVQLIQIVALPYLPRLAGVFIPAPLISMVLPVIYFAFNALFALGLLLVGVAVFMDRHKW